MLITMELSARWKKDSKYRQETWVSLRQETTLQASSYQLSSRIMEEKVVKEKEK